MPLKTDYKDDVFEGDRQYEKVTNENSTWSFRDVTNYIQEGDSFGAADINRTNAAVNRLNHVSEVSLLASAWEGESAPYSQTVPLSEATEDTDALLVSALADGASVETQRAYNKAFSIVSSGCATIGAGSVTFKVYKKPATDLVVGLKGV